MKSESSPNTMLRLIILVGLVALAQSTANINKPAKKQTEIKYMKSASAIDLKKQQFQSTKERPELNPVLSALINEDIKKSIDSKRHAEYDFSSLSEVPSVTAAAALSQPTTVAPVQTTVKYIPKAHDDTVVVDSIAGSSFEKKQTSRIEIKKGPNGIDYEYEYVYYYYDEDDDKDSKKLPAVSDDKSIESQNGGKNRYDKSSTTPKPNFERNELPTSRGKGRQSIPVIEETSEERLPANTRFPPRSAVTPTVQVLSNVDETTKKISVKRPSLELVDSQLFNRGEKGQSKGSRVLENEFAKINDARLNENPTVIPSITELVSQNAASAAIVGIASSEVTTAASDSEESTTQIMDKVALDLYAHLVNENSNVDLSTETAFYDESSTTDSLLTTTEELSTIETLTSTTTTTTEAPTTTTTTTTETPTFINGRRTPLGAGRRNPLKSRSKSSETNAEESKESRLTETTVQDKPKNRFSRPSFSARSRPTPTVAAVTNSEEEEIVKQKAKPLAAVTASRGRTRNRFNLRTSTPQPNASEEKNPDENAIDSSVHSSSTTQRALRTRPTFNLRGRSRATPSSTSAPSSEATISETKSDSEEKSVTSNPLKPVSRFSLRRPNQLLAPRGRLSPLAKPSAPSAEQSSEVINSTDASNSTPTADWSKELIEESEQVAAEPSTTPQTGLNRLRNRPRIQIQPKSANTNKQPTTATYNNANRKVNPLISRRKIGSTTTTEESPVTENNEASEEIKEPQSELSKEINSSENDKNAKEEAPAAPVEASSEPPRGLGLLANRRRLAIRRPGTIL